MTDVCHYQTDGVVHSIELVLLRVLAHFAFEMCYTNLNLSLPMSRIVLCPMNELRSLNYLSIFDLFRRFPEKTFLC